MIFYSQLHLQVTFIEIGWLLVSCSSDLKWCSTVNKRGFDGIFTGRATLQLQLNDTQPSESTFNVSRCEVSSDVSIYVYSEEHNTHLSCAAQVHLIKQSTKHTFISVNVKVTDVSVYFFEIGQLISGS